MNELIEELEKRIEGMESELEWLDHYSRHIENKDEDLHHSATIYANYVCDSTKTFKI
jgi:chaperonin cofactor prefoldin